jgi:hypothetical protein
VSYKYHVKTQQVDPSHANRIIKQWCTQKNNLTAPEPINDKAKGYWTSFEKYFEIGDYNAGIFGPYLLILSGIPDALVGAQFLGGKPKKIDWFCFIDDVHFYSIMLSSKESSPGIFRINLSEINDVVVKPFSGTFVGYQISLHYSRRKQAAAADFLFGPEMESIGFLDTLRRARIARELSNISSAAIEQASYDCFISYATEDRVSVATPLATHLRDKGLSVWFDQFSLKIGDSIRKKVDQGLSQSLFGIVILSRHFFEKNWTQYELDGLVSRELSSGEKLILPIWHKLSSEEIRKHSASLAGKLALSTTEMELEDIATEIEKVISERKDEITRNISSP